MVGEETSKSNEFAIMSHFGREIWRRFGNRKFGKCPLKIVLGGSLETGSSYFFGKIYGWVLVAWKGLSQGFSHC